MPKPSNQKRSLTIRFLPTMNLLLLHPEAIIQTERLVLVYLFCSRSRMERILMMILLNTRAPKMMMKIRLMDFCMMNLIIDRQRRRHLISSFAIAPNRVMHVLRLFNSLLLCSHLDYPHPNPRIHRNRYRLILLPITVPLYHHNTLRYNHQVRGMEISMTIIGTQEHLWLVERGGHLPAPVHPSKG